MTSSLRKLEHVIGQNAFRFEATVKYQPLDTLNQVHYLRALPTTTTAARVRVCVRGLETRAEG
jgi:hypothetical protein